MTLPFAALALRLRWFQVSIADDFVHFDSATTTTPPTTTTTPYVYKYSQVLTFIAFESTRILGLSFPHWNWQPLLQQ